MRYAKLKERYAKLEIDVVCELIKLIEKSKIKSKFFDTPCIEVNVFDYVELMYVDEALRFVDSRGLHYSLYAECSLEDLIDILMKIE